jgi:hypothetical protein
METASCTDVSETDGAAPRLPIGYRILFWVVIVELMGLTVFVWTMVFRAAALAGHGYAVPYNEFGRLLVGYHFLLMFWLCLAWIMQMVWRLMGTLGLFPVALVIGAGSLHIAVFQLAWMLQGFGE